MPDVGLPIDQVLLGDCVEIMDALPARSIDLVFADPPYNLQLTGDLHRPDRSRVQPADDAWDQFGDGGAAASFAEYDLFTRAWLTAARRVMKDDASLWVIGTYHNIHRVGAILMDLGFWILNDVIWVKSNPTPQMRGVRFCNGHETLIWAKKGQSASGIQFPYRELKAGNEDRQMRAEWQLPICSGHERITVDGLKVHSTQKPEALLHRVLVSSSSAGDLVLDPFCGTGTTAAVARRLGRRFITMDREERYVEVARRRVAAIAADPIPCEAPQFDGPPARIPFVELVELGHVPVGARLRFVSTGEEAVVCPDGNLLCRGVKGSIHGIGRLCGGSTACNGWEHWHLVDPTTGATRLLNDIRRELGAAQG